MKPLLPIEFWIPLMLLLSAALVYSARSSLNRLGRKAGMISLMLRSGTLLAMGILLLNPGRFAPKTETDAATAWILIDRSASMATRVEDGPSRYLQALDWAQPELDPELDLQVATFAGELDPALDADALKTQQADGDHTDIGGSLEQLLKTIRGDPRPCRGILLLSDGISLSTDDQARRLGLAARADNIPISARQVGEAPRHPDLSLELPQTLYTVTAGADRPLHGRIRSRNLPPLRTRIHLINTDGKTVDSRMLELEADTDTPFEIQSGQLEAGLHRFRMELEPVEGETLTENNQAELRVQAVEVSLKVLMLEGIPHWDSKFLTQWLRNQHGVELTTLHRLSDNRWFRVNAGEDTPDTDAEGVLPDEHQDFRNYDVILVGRGLDYLATSQTTAALHRFVKDHGGVLIFTRGRPVSAAHPGIESLMPLQWLDERSSEHLAEPAPGGIRAGLFGDLLPGPADPLWQDLPGLRGLRRLRINDPLTTVLMRAGRGVEDEDPWPVLLGRRVGSGRVMLINGEGMWHWDFRSELPRQEKWYGQFWSQLLLWVVQSSRFQPGFDYSLEAAAYPSDLQQPVIFEVRHRLETDLQDRNPEVLIRDEQGESLRLPLQPGKDQTLQAVWTGRRPGFYAVSVVEGVNETPPRYYTVATPPGELEDLVPRDQPLKELVEISGGIWFDGEGVPAEAFAKSSVEEITADTEAVWQPHWTRAWWLLGLIALPAADWSLRRRKGLI